MDRNDNKQKLNLVSETSYTLTVSFTRTRWVSALRCGFLCHFGVFLFFLCRWHFAACLLGVFFSVVPFLLRHPASERPQWNCFYYYTQYFYCFAISANMAFGVHNYAFDLFVLAPIPRTRSHPNIYSIDCNSIRAKGAPCVRVRFLLLLMDILWHRVQFKIHC